jgi:hypothetical protein
MRVISSLLNYRNICIGLWINNRISDEDEIDIEKEIKTEREVVEE